MIPENRRITEDSKSVKICKPAAEIQIAPLKCRQPARVASGQSCSMDRVMTA